MTFKNEYLSVDESQRRGIGSGPEDGGLNG